ncbi:MAG: DUF4332 domain-containing protein [Planctomycetota bacterium]
MKPLSGSMFFDELPETLRNRFVENHDYLREAIMLLTDVCVDHYGSLNHVSVEKFSRQVTLLYGSDETGRTTFVRFLRGLFYGFRRQSAMPFGDLVPADVQKQSGQVRVLTDGGPRSLRRSWTVQGEELLSLVDERVHSEVVFDGSLLPSWVSDDVFREIFSAGADEADRFDLLTRLCVESCSRGAADIDLRQAEAALEQTIRDRDGNGVQGGVVHRISELRRRQGDLQSEIGALRKPGSDVQLKIEQLLRTIESDRAGLDRMNAELTAIRSELSQLELLLIELRRRNVLTLDRVKLEQEVQSVTAKLSRWREIRASISREFETHRIAGDLSMQADDSVRSIRAIISRLEDRSLALTEPAEGPAAADLQRHQDANVLRQLRSEIAALCQYFGQHEQATVLHLESLQAMAVERTLADASQMERLLDEQLTTLRNECSRCDNILSPAAIPRFSDGRGINYCRYSGHEELSVADLGYRGNVLTIAEVEAQLAQLRSEQSRLWDEREFLEQSHAAGSAMLERLRQDVSSAATLEQLDALRAGFAELDAEVSLLEDQRRQLDRAEQSFREVIDRLKGRGFSRVFELATAFARRLTDGEIREISAIAPDRLVFSVNHRSDPISLTQLRQGTRDLVGLALRLALIQIRRESNGHVPLILDDVFISADSPRAVAAVELLTEVAATGQQIIFLTGHQHVRDLFARFQADIRSLVRSEAPAPVPMVLQAFIEPAVELREAIPEPVVAEQPESPPQLTAEPTQLPGSTNWLFYLEVDHGVEDLAGMTLGELEALRSAGILTIDDLLNSTVPQLEQVTRQKGFTVSVERLHSLRGQAELTTRIPMLRRSDAALLFAAGVHSPEELRRLRPETVYDRVTEFQRTDAGARYRRGGRLIDRQQAINWARYGQFTRSLEEARHSRSLFATRSATRTVARDSQGAGDAAVSLRSESETVATRRRPRRRGEDLDLEERRARRQARRQRQVSRLRTLEQVDTTDDEAPVERIGGMRFFLSRTSDVEKAPSIGPRTAAILARIGVRTVEDLLSMPPDRISEKLGHRRLTPSVIQQWQAQSRMMCLIPELRGHDAQILVACHVMTPESLASQKPAELLAVVEPFCRSKEAERILRHGGKPDLAEVTEWIQWAANARSMRAA